MRNALYFSRPLQLSVNKNWNRQKWFKYVQIRRYSKNKEQESMKTLLEDEDSIHKSGTMAEVKVKMEKRLGLDSGFQSIPKSRENLLKYTPKPENLPDRSIRDSLTSVIVPLRSDKGIQDEYVTVLGRLRLGRLMEDIDLFAVWVCHMHVSLPKLPKHVHLPYTFVTLLVDKVEFTKNRRTKATEDIRLIGHVSWTGKTSMEISIWIYQQEGETWKSITKAIFVMVARNATNTGQAPINKLKPADDEEAAIIAEAVKRRNVRRNKEATSVLKVVPTDYEQSLIHNIFLRTIAPETMDLNKRVLPPNCCWMSDAHQSITTYTYPQHRNSQNTVFGGYIMRVALEITYINALKYCKKGISLQSISDISFNQPISMESVLHITAYIVYTVKNYIQLMTVVDVLGVHNDSRKTTNVFYFTYASEDIVKTVLPITYHETMWYIHGRRKFMDTMNIPVDYEYNEPSVTEKNKEKANFKQLKGKAATPNAKKAKNKLRSVQTSEDSDGTAKQKNARKKGKKQSEKMRKDKKKARNQKSGEKENYIQQSEEKMCKD